MRWTSILAIYMLFWILAAFLVMPFGVRTPDEAGVDKVPGQVESAPANFNPRRIVTRATVLSLVLFVLYYLNFINRWITIEDLDLTKWLGWY
jgi:predicted secreted protein